MSKQEIESAREKLRLLERLYAEAVADKEGDADARDAELESLERQINQFQEQIARDESRHTARRT